MESVQKLAKCGERDIVEKIEKVWTFWGNR